MYLPPGVSLSEKTVRDTDLLTPHGGSWVYHGACSTRVLDTMAPSANEECDQPLLWMQEISCCKVANPPQGELPVDRTQGSYPFDSRPWE